LKPIRYPTPGIRQILGMFRKGRPIFKIARFYFEQPRNQSASYPVCVRVRLPKPQFKSKRKTHMTRIKMIGSFSEKDFAFETN